MPTALLFPSPGHGRLAELAELDACAPALAGWRLLAVTRWADDVAARGLVPLDAERVAAVARAAIRADALVVAGGHLDNLVPGTAAGAAGLAARAVVLPGIALPSRTVALIGVDARRTGGRFAAMFQRTLVRNADLLVVRDGASAANLVALGAQGPFRVGADPVWSLFKSRTPKPRAAGRVLVVPPPPVTRDSATAAVPLRLAAALRELKGAGLEVAIQPWDGDPASHWVSVQNDGIEATLDTSNLLPRPRTFLDASEAMAEFGCVVACREHASIAAAAAGVPVVRLGIDTGTGDLRPQLGDIILAPDDPPATIARAVVSCATSASPPEEVIKEQIARAEEGIRLLRILLCADGDAEDQPLGALPLEPSPH